MGDSLKRQTEITETICRENGWELDKSLRIDRGVSAYRGGNIANGSLAEFILEVEKGKIETPCVLVVEAMDRLSRASLITARDLLEKLIRLDVSICTANNRKVYDKVYLENPFDMIFSLVEMNIAHEYSKNLGRRSKAAWKRKKEKAREGIVLTRKLPAWIILPIGKKNCEDFIIDESKANIVKRIFNEYLEGKGSRTIAVRLTKDRVKPFGKAKEWNVTSVFRVLKSKNVIGEYQPTTHISKSQRIIEEATITDYYPSIIDKTTFYRVQDNIEKKLVPRGPKRNLFNLITGIVFCKKCNSNMILKTGAVTKKRKYPYLSLVCARGWKGGDCDYRSVRYEMIESSILTIFSKNIIIDFNQVRKNNTELKKAKKSELSQVQKTLNNLEQITRDPEIENISKSVVKSLAEFEEKEEQLKKEIELLENKPDIINDGVFGWKPIEETIENRMKLQMVIRSIINKIVIDAENQSGEIFINESAGQHPFIVKWDKKNKLSFLLNEKVTRYDYKGNIWKLNPNAKKRGLPQHVLDFLKYGIKEKVYILQGMSTDIITFMGESIECDCMTTDGKKLYIEKFSKNGKNSRCFYNLDGEIIQVIRSNS